MGLQEIDWQNQLLLIEKIIILGEELSNQPSELILKQVDSTIKQIVQTISLDVSKSFGEQIVDLKKPTPFIFQSTFLKKPIAHLKRTQTKSSYLLKYIEADELLKNIKLTQQANISSKQDIESIESDQLKLKDVYLVALQQFQKLHVIGECFPYLAVECFIYSVNAFEIFCLAYLLTQLGKDGVQSLTRSHRSNDSSLIQMIYRATELSKLLNINPNNSFVRVNNPDTPFILFNNLIEWFLPICDDKVTLKNQIEKTNLFINEMTELIKKKSQIPKHLNRQQ